MQKPTIKSTILPWAPLLKIWMSAIVSIFKAKDCVQTMATALRLEFLASSSWISSTLRNLDRWCLNSQLENHRHWLRYVRHRLPLLWSPSTFTDIQLCLVCDKRLEPHQRTLRPDVEVGQIQTPTLQRVDNAEGPRCSGRWLHIFDWARDLGQTFQVNKNSLLVNLKRLFIYE